MGIQEIVNRKTSKWMEGTGPESNIVISSRVRLARNLKDYPFPHQLSEEEARGVLAQVDKGISQLWHQEQAQSGRDSGQLELIYLDEKNSLEQQILMEKHLLSPNFIKQTRPKGFVVNNDDTISIMVNEEDHLRIQCLLPGLQLEQAWELADQVDDYLEQSLDYAFDEALGYLTACPTNTGTGFRASVMLHLPGLVITGQVNRIMNFLSQIGLTVRGIYGEGSEAKGNLFQISNQITLGIDEQEIVNNLHGVTKQLVEQEEAARQILLEQGKHRLVDRVLRALGTLNYAHVISSNEAISLLSDVRLGIDLDLITNLDQQVLTQLMAYISPGYLQRIAGQELTPEERDIRRAEVIRKEIGANFQDENKSQGQKEEG